MRVPPGPFKSALSNTLDPRSPVPPPSSLHQVAASRLEYSMQSLLATRCRLGFLPIGGLPSAHDLFAAEKHLTLDNPLMLASSFFPFPDERFLRQLRFLKSPFLSDAMAFFFSDFPDLPSPFLIRLPDWKRFSHFLPLPLPPSFQSLHDGCFLVKRWANQLGPRSASLFSVDFFPLPTL